MAQHALAEEHAHSNDEALEHLYREHAPTVYRYALGVLRNPADAEDIVQSTFTNAYRAMLGGEQPEKAENWLIKIAHNECRQRFRRLGRRAIEVPLDDDVVELATPEDEAETAGEIDGVLKALGELPLNQRTALVLREVAGRSATEIAQFLGTSVSSVDMLLFRARRTLRERSASPGALALVPLPRSLLSIGGAGKGAAIAGGVGLTAKAAAVLVAGAVAAGGGSVGTRTADTGSPAPAGRPAQTQKSTLGPAADRSTDRRNAPAEPARATGAPAPATVPAPATPTEPETTASVVRAATVAPPPVPALSSSVALPSMPSPPRVEVPGVPSAPVLPVPEPPVIVVPELPAAPPLPPPVEDPLP